MKLTQIDRIEQEYEAHTPVVVLHLYTPTYATEPGYEAGLRSIEGCVVEWASVSYSDVEYLRNKYDPNLHYLLDDDSVTEGDWLAAASLYNSDAPHALTCDLADAIDFITTALRASGKCNVTIDGAIWEVTR